MAKIAVTPTIVLAEFILFRKTISFQKVKKFYPLSLLLSFFSLIKHFKCVEKNYSSPFFYFSYAANHVIAMMMQVLALAVVSVGVAVATVTDLEFNLFGAVVAVIWIIPSAINKILWSTLQQQGNWTALA